MEESKYYLIILIYNSSREILKQIRNNPINYTKKEWSGFSYDFKVLLSSMLTINWTERPSALQILNCKLFKKYVYKRIYY